MRQPEHATEQPVARLLSFRALLPKFVRLYRMTIDRATANGADSLQQPVIAALFLGRDTEDETAIGNQQPGIGNRQPATAALVSCVAA